MAAGHHTTYQHANFVFILDCLSRLAIWSFFHHHPYCDLEQVSYAFARVIEEGKSPATHSHARFTTICGITSACS